MRSVLLRLLLIWLVLLAAACKGVTTGDFVSKQEGFKELVTGYPISVTMVKPKVTKLADGTAYTITNDKSKVLMEFDKQVPGTRRKMRRNYTLKAGDIFIQSRPFSYILIKK